MSNKKTGSRSQSPNRNKTRSKKFTAFRPGQRVPNARLAQILKMIKAQQNKKKK